jgi:hypothetical protein
MDCPESASTGATILQTTKSAKSILLIVMLSVPLLNPVTEAVIATN